MIIGGLCFFLMLVFTDFYVNGPDGHSYDGYC